MSQATLIIKANQIGFGLYTTTAFSKDDIVLELTGPIADKPSRESIHIGNNRHICDDLGMYVNHSFDPTTRVESTSLIALRYLEPLTEVTFNYNESELTMAAPFYVGDRLVGGSLSAKN